MASEIAREAAEKIVSFTFDDYVDNSMNRGELIEYIGSMVATAIATERENAARIAEGHSATDCNGPDCGVVIAAAIRNQSGEE